jgi:hypothetical protein
VPENTKVVPEGGGQATAEEILYDFSEKSYERELQEGETIWRTMPLFPISFGFAVALIGYAWVSAPEPTNDLATWMIYLPISAPALLFFPAFRWLWKMVGLRTFRYLPDDLSILAYAQSLRDYYTITLGDATKVEEAVAFDLKAYLFGEWAAAASHNQAHNQERSYARGRTVFYLMACIALALLTNALILVGNKFGFQEAKEHAAQSAPGAGVSAPSPARAPNAAKAPIRR